MSCAIHYVLVVYLIVLAARAVLSWFPVRSDSPLASVNSILFDITEPVLRPVRQVIPPAGMLDTSFIVVFFVILILENVITC